MKTPLAWKAIYSSEDFQKKFDYDGELGAIVSENGTDIRIWSPFADKVTVHFYPAGNDVPENAAFPMEKGTRGVWRFHSDQNLHGTYYDFTLSIEGNETRTADPYARAAGVNGVRSMVVDLPKTDPDGWDADKPPAAETETVIWETHVKEFSWDKSGGFPEEYRGKYKAFTCTDTHLPDHPDFPTGLRYLKNLGITHVELLPVFDYGSVDEAADDDAFNWGYDPVNYNVPEGSYSTDSYHGEVRIRELKEAIQVLHRAGLRVIMDVVYNHTWHIDSVFQRTVPDYYYRVNPDGTYSNGSGCGDDFASEEPMAHRYIVNSVLYWAREYHFDGFRFDLMGLIDTDTMNEIRARLDAEFGKGEKIIFGEPWSANQTAIRYGKKLSNKANINLLDENIGMFSDDIRDGIRGSALRAKEVGFINMHEEAANAGREPNTCVRFSRPMPLGGHVNQPENAVITRRIRDGISAYCRNGSGVKAPSQIVSYVSAHDNQTLWDKLTSTTPSAGLRKRQYRMAAGIYMTCQGRLFMLAGEEFARTKNGVDNSYNLPITLNRLDWHLAWENRDLVRYWTGLIALRKRISALTDKSPAAPDRIRIIERLPEDVIGFFADEKYCIFYNSLASPVEIRLPDGAWKLLLGGEDSFAWKKPRSIHGRIKLAPVSVTIFGK